MLTSCRKSIMQGLTVGEASAILNSPNLVSRNRRLSMPHMGKDLSASSAIFRAPAGIVSSGQRVSIGRPFAQRPMFREDSAASLRPGSVVIRSASSFLIPENLVRFPHGPEL